MKYVHSKWYRNNARPTDVFCVFICLAYMELHHTLAFFIVEFDDSL